MASGEMSVLLAADGSAHALRAARLLASLLRQDAATVHLLTVLSFELLPQSYLGELSDAGERQARILEAERGAFGESLQILSEAGIHTTTGHRFGNPGDELLAEIRQTKPDLVVVGRRGLGRAATLLLGSVSERILHNAGVPVLVVP